ncbi:MAG TPA: alanine racemase [Gemmatimonadales bacterium]
MTTPFTPETARAWVDIDLAALAENARTVATVSGRPLMPMVKANGYGLGAIEVARALESVEPWGFGVATIEEGTALRRAGITRPILIASPLLPADLERCHDQDLRPSIGDPVTLESWVSRSDRPFHVELDTGMSRGGVRWNDGEALDAMRAALSSAGGWEGLYTHFHSAETDLGSVQLQWDRLQGVLATMPRRPALVHAANSAAALRGTAFAADLVRPGIFLYGCKAGAVEPRPVVALRARVVAVRSVEKGGTVSYGATWSAKRKTVIATLGLGYADGFPRATREGRTARSRPTRVIEMGGHTNAVVGRVTMDLTMVAVGGHVAMGDVATVYGGIVSLDQQAEAAGTISYELLTGLGARLPRRYAGT